MEDFGLSRKGAEKKLGKVKYFFKRFKPYSS